MLRPVDFIKWVDESSPGASTEYFRGATVQGGCGRIAVGECAWQYALRGAVTLVRKRLPGGKFSFRAVRLTEEGGKVLRPAPLQ